MASQSQDVKQRLLGLVSPSESRRVFMQKDMDAPALKQVSLWTQNLLEGLQGLQAWGRLGLPSQKGHLCSGPCFPYL